MNLNKDLQVAGYVMIPRALLLRTFEEHREAVGDMNAFLRVLTYVNYAEAMTKCCNTEVACRRGESVISFSHWAEILGWTIGRTRRFFNRLIADGGIELVKGDCVSHIRIPGYDAWVGKRMAGKADAATTFEEGFGTFWDEYHEITRMPRKSREETLREWKKMSLEERKLAQENIEEYYYHLRNTKYCCQAAKYLANKLFQDEYDN